MLFLFKELTVLTRSTGLILQLSGNFKQEIEGAPNFKQEIEAALLNPTTQILCDLLQQAKYFKTRSIDSCQLGNPCHKEET